jgi:choline kinase
MKLILLAAGKSSRIYKKIKKNKCLLTINNKSLLRNIIDNAKSISLNDINIVTGFKASNIINELKNYKKINFIKNLKFASTDMVYSTILALKNSNDDVLISYTDIFFDKDLLKNFKKNKYKYITLPYIENWKEVWNFRKKNIHDDAETFIYNNDHFLKEIGNKITSNNLKNINGQFMGIIYIPKEFVKKILFFYDKHNFKKIQFTCFLNKLLKNKFKIYCKKYKKFWYEIDDNEDYENFHRFYSQYKKSS